MSLADAAQHVQSMGRGNDSMLIHMSPREIAGLQAIAEHHGGSLTINPETGLHEAGFLEDILPMIAGIALNAFIPGLGAVTSGLLVGGATAAVTGDLQKGLMAGLGAFGGAGAASSLAKLGGEAGVKAAASGAAGALDDAAVAAARGGQDVSQALAKSYMPAAQQGAQQAAMQGAQQAGAMQSGAIQAANQGMRQGAAQMTGAQQVGQQAAMQGARPPMSEIAQGGLDRLKQMGQGIRNLGQPGTAEAVSDMAMPIGAAMLPMLQGMQSTGQPKEEEYEPTNPFIKRRLSPNFNGFVPNRPQPYYIPTGVGYARGGVTRARRLTSHDLDQLPDFAPPGMYYGEGIAPDLLPADQAAQKQVQEAFAGARLRPQPLPKHAPIAMAAGGLSAGMDSLSGYSDGGRLLKGPGDGMSDNIPAHVGGEQPVRLADGEFVVSADVVSGLGNGSTDAGAKKLYEMMARVREARTGKKKQAPAIKSDKLLPA